MQQKVVTANPQLCAGCRQCELFCSYHHEGVYSPRLSRIKVVSYEDRCLHVPVTCAYCEEPVCEQVCPVGAISHDPVTGAARVNEDQCLGCKECVNACPLGAMDLHPVKGVAIRCDLCEGDPVCVKYCPEGALKFEPLYHTVKDKRRARVAALNLE
ncbi:4Fe-4S dicluster domain-containing protein [Moorellaceae bacterium AZ2]